MANVRVPPPVIVQYCSHLPYLPEHYSLCGSILFAFRRLVVGMAMAIACSPSRSPYSSFFFGVYHIANVPCFSEHYPLLRCVLFAFRRLVVGIGITPYPTAHILLSFFGVWGNPTVLAHHTSTPLHIGKTRRTKI